jgi:hypothetical protein
LRSRSGFEKPGSREEAIMQNILGASNVLEPSESNIEEILKSILYNTPYTKEAEFEIEKILLAIKNNGTYDGECESRDLKILFAILNDLDYTEEAESRIEELFIEWLNQRSKVKVLEGIPPLTFIAKGEPLINYEISGNTMQNGTPTPDNPIMPQGTGDMVENLFDKTSTHTTSANTELYTITGLTPNQSYTCSTSFVADPTKSEASIYFGGGNSATNGVSSNSPKTMTANSNGEISLYIRSVQTSNSNVAIFNDVIAGTIWVMVNAGTTPIPYGYKIPILSASTTTPVYLGEVESTRRIKKLVLTGQESIDTVEVNGVNLFRVPTDYTIDKIQAAANLSMKCNAYPIATDRGTCAGTNNTMSTFNQTRDLRIVIHNNTYTTADDFKTYLQQQYAAGTPVTVWYVLANETTGIVNEPIRKIGDYADTLSMEQAGVQIPTNNGTTVIDVDTTVKPSNIYIEYK